MILKTKGIVEKNNLINIFYESGFELSESLYFNFADNKIYLNKEDGFNETAFARFNMDIEGDVACNNFLVDSLKLLHLSKHYETLELKDYTFFNNSDSFKINYTEQTDEDDLIDSEIFEYIPTNSITFTKELIADIKTATLFLNKNSNDASGKLVAIVDNTIVSVDNKEVQVYEKKLDIDLPDVLLSTLAISLIQTLGEGCLLQFNENKMSLEYKDIEVIFSNPNSVDEEGETIDFYKSANKDERFIETYNHSTYITLEKESLEDIIEFFIPFVKNNINSIALFEIEEDNKLKISIGEGEEGMGYTDLVVRHINYIFTNCGGKFILDLNQLNKNLKVFNLEVITFQIPMNDYKMINLKESDSHHICFAKYADEE